MFSNPDGRISLQRLYIIWQSGNIDVHEQAVYADSRASSPAIGVLSQSVAAIIPPPLVATEDAILESTGVLEQAFEEALGARD